MFHPKDHQLRWKEVPNATKSTKDSVLILLAMLLQTSNSTRTHVLHGAGHCPMTGVAVLWFTFSHGTLHTEHSPHTRWSVQTYPGSGMVLHCLAGVSPSEEGCSHWKLCIVVIIQSLWNERYKGRYEVSGPQSENYLEKIFPRGGGAESDQVMNVIVACSMLYCCLSLHLHHMYR